MMKQRTLPVRRIGLILAAILLLSVGLLFDLRQRGQVWNLFWSLTGEEDTLSQLRGMVEWAGNILRPSLNTQPNVPINHVDVPPYGINTFLQQEVEVVKRERSLQMIADAGFKMIRQQFEWADIEIGERGNFIDQRNDLNGDGAINEQDAISAWAKYDNIVDLAEQYGIQIQARLDNPPAWSRANPDSGDKAPPDDFQDFVNFAVAVAERYQGRIRYYQIWNEPNANEEWGNQPVSPEGYTDLLCRTYHALKTVDPTLVIISGPLSPTVSLTDRNLNEFIFLQRMYDAGARDCFDVMSAQGYGFYSGPTDRRMRPMTLTYARHIYIRDIMVSNGDAAKPIWISEAAWNPQPDDPSIIQNGAFGIVTEEQAARYMPLAYQRAQEEWPWLGNISYWFFKRPADYERGQAFYYFRMVEPDFTPLPIYDSMKQYITGQTPTLYAGVHQAEKWMVESSDAVLVNTDGAEFGAALEAAQLQFIAHATEIFIRYRTADDVPWETKRWWSSGSLTAQTHTLNIIPDNQERWHFDSITVIDRTFQNILPLASGALIALSLLVYIILSALRERRRS
ncbi:MAG: cellulase family glycosylhydrolase [Anaerolineae bacterium]|nr:cellulase family glycosylhydrolase [Anaerolineae bacterium]